MLTLFAALVASVASESLSYTEYANNVLSGETSAQRDVTDLGSVNVGSGVSSARLMGTLTMPAEGWQGFACSFAGTSLAFVWVDGHLVCTDGKSMPDPKADVLAGNIDNPIRVSSRLVLPFRAHFYRNSTAPGDSAVFGMSWLTNGSTKAIAASSLGNVLPDEEQKREELQRGAAKGWSNWNQYSILDFVKMPDSAVVATQLCKGEVCIRDTRIEPGRAGDCEVRVGARAGDLSYGQFFVGSHSNGLAVNVSIEFSSSAAGDLTLLVTPQANTTGSGHILRLAPRFAWFREGTTKTTSTNITLQGAGLTPIVVYTSAGVVTGNSLDISLDNGPVAVSTVPGVSVAGVARMLSGAGAAHRSKLEAVYGAADLTEVAVAVEAAAMWNLIYTPFENGPMLPVSRVWNFNHYAVTTDFNYATFDWDNLFAAMLAGVTTREYALSNFIQVMKSKTSAGFIPNFSAAGQKSQDRTEPPIGAKVAKELYARFPETWFLEVVFDDLLDWSNWFLRERLLEPLNMVCLGSWNELVALQTPPHGTQVNNMQGARFESGLDNSPMYDGEFFNTTTHKMQLYDVGMTSMVAQEAAALADLADILGRPEAPMLRARSASFTNLLATHLWHDDLGIFVNKFPNNTFYERISPTSFYPLQVKAATDTQADTMVSEWLLSPEHFCISPTGDMAGNHDDCYWGLPSIQRSDVAFPPLGYWRGYIWGPMAQLTFWALQQYDTPTVTKGRKAMCKQMKALLLSQWNEHRHICENFGPHKNTTDCTGTTFYHWGALTGLISIMEEGLWAK